MGNGASAVAPPEVVPVCFVKALHRDADGRSPPVTPRAGVQQLSRCPEQDASPLSGEPQCVPCSGSSTAGLFGALRPHDITGVFLTSRDRATAALGKVVAFLTTPGTVSSLTPEEREACTRSMQAGVAEIVGSEVFFAFVVAPDSPEARALVEEARTGVEEGAYYGHVFVLHTGERA